MQNVKEIYFEMQSSGYRAEPLLQRIKEERTAVVCPIIDIIEDKTLQYSDPNSFLIGGFNWNGEFTWISIPPYEVSRKKYHHSPTRSPTMAGGLFAIDRKYFWEMGSYDSDMQVEYSAYASLFNFQ